MTLLLFLVHLHFTEIPLHQAGQTAAPMEIHKEVSR